MEMLKTKIVPEIDYRDLEAIKIFEEYCHMTVDDVLKTPSKTCFVDYKELGVSRDFQVHASTNIVESLPLSSVQPPIPTNSDYKLPPDVDLSAIQIDAVRLAATRFQKRIPTGEVAGFLLGDGPGLGKTRVLAAIIYNEYLKGHKRHLFLSISEYLFNDVKEEFRKIAPNSWVEEHVKSLEDESLLDIVNLNAYTGVLFMTYRRLKNAKSWTANDKNDSPKVKHLSGLDVIEKFFVQETSACGVIVLDESHVGKNALHSVVDLRSKTGELILKVVNTYKDAKIVYSTATPASFSRHFGILSRLEIWSPDKYWKNFANFEKLMSKWELAAAELLSLKLKHQGAMVCRQMSFDGVEINSEKVTLSEGEQAAYEKLYSKYSKMWREMHKDMLEIAANCNDDERKTKIATFFAAMMNFFRSIINHSKLNYLVEIIRNEVGLGNAVVVGIQGTGESSYREFIKNQNMEHDNVISNAKEIMDKLVKQHFLVATKKRSMHTRKRKRNDSDSERQDKEFDLSRFGSTCDTATCKEGSADNGYSENTNSILDQDLFLSSSEDEDGDDDGNGKPENSAPIPSQRVGQDQSLDLKSSDVATIRYDGVKSECVNLPEVTKIREKWLLKIKQIIDTPPNFLDELQNRLSKFNEIKVAEITGRRFCIKQQITSDETITSSYVAQKRLKYQIQQRNISIDEERNKFMEDHANVAIISDAGSTGISLHASKDCKNKRKRIHITVELGWSAEKVLQQLGRTHRTNQVQTPEYRFLLSNVPAEIRFISIVLGRLSAMSTFSCAQRNIKLCDQLNKQVQYDSNAAIHGIFDAVAYFYGKETVIPYKNSLVSDNKVKDQLNGFGFNEDQEQRMFSSLDSRTSKRVPLTRTLNKLLACALDAQREFCDVWEYFMTHYKQTHDKPRGVVVIPSSYCQVHCYEEGTDNLVKQPTKTGIQFFGDLDSTDGDHLETVGSHKNSTISRPHGPIQLVQMLVYIGSTVGTVNQLHSSASKCDKISGFFIDYGKIATRYFYLQTVEPMFNEIEYNMVKEGQNPGNIQPHAVVCLLHQPHQPPMELNVKQVLKFREKMIRMYNCDMVTRGWVEQSQKLNHVCIHQYSLGECRLQNCMIGKRLEVKYLVEGDLPAIWPDIVATLRNEDPTVVVAQTQTVEKGMSQNKTRFGIIIPRGSSQELRLRVLGHEIDFI